MRTLAPRSRIAVAALTLVVVFVSSILAAPTTRNGVVLGLALDGALASLSVLSSRDLRKRRPTLARALGSVVVVDVALGATFFFSANTNYNLAIGAAMAIVLLGLSFLTGISGQISLGNSAFMGVGALAVAIWANHHASTPLVVTLLIAVACGAVAGLLLGLPAARLRGPYLAGMTLAFAVAFTAIVNSFTSWTGGDAGLQLPNAVTAPRWMATLFDSQSSPLALNSAWLADVTIVAAGVSFFLMANLIHSRAGRAMRLLRDNDVAAEIVGVSLARSRVLAFVVSSAYAALGGGLWTLINNSVSPPAYSFALSITILSLVVIGGIGTVSGALLGGVIYAYSASVISWITTQTGLNPQGNLASQLNGIIFGALLVLVMLFAPLGIVGLIRRLHRRLASKLPG